MHAAQRVIEVGRVLTAEPSTSTVAIHREPLGDPRIDVLNRDNHRGGEERLRPRLKRANESTL